MIQDKFFNSGFEIMKCTSENDALDIINNNYIKSIIFVGYSDIVNFCLYKLYVDNIYVYIDKTCNTEYTLYHYFKIKYIVNGVEDENFNNELLQIYNYDYFINNYQIPLLEYKGMFNWTNDIPKDTKQIFLNNFDYINQLNKDKVNILEIGTYTGVSIVNILNYIKNSYATTIDIWDNYDESEQMKNYLNMHIEKSFYYNVEISNLQERVLSYKGKSNDILPKLIKYNIMYDVVIIDGSHLCLDAYHDIVTSWYLLNIGGLMFIDDYLFNYLDEWKDSPHQGVNHFLKDYEGKYEILHKAYRIILKKIKE